MATETLGREVVQGTICRDRFKASVTVVCSDAIPPGAASPLALAIRWRQERDGSGPPGMPDEAKPIVLSLRKRTAAATGDIRFDRAGGPTEKGFTADTTELLTIHGQAATAGVEADVLLEVKIEGQVMGNIPLAVRPAAFTLAIRGANGVDAPPPALHVGAPITLKAAVTPATAGSFEWLTIDPDALRINGPEDAETVEIEAIGKSVKPRLACVLFKPPSGPAVLASHGFPLGLRFAGQIEDRSVAPHFREAATGHRFLPAGTPIEIVDAANAVVLRAATAADGRFDVALLAGQTYRLRVPGLEGLGP